MERRTVKRRKKFVVSRYAGVSSAARIRADINFGLAVTARRLALAVGDRKGLMPSVVMTGRNAYSRALCGLLAFLEKRDGQLVQDGSRNCKIESGGFVCRRPGDHRPDDHHSPSQADLEGSWSAQSQHIRWPPQTEQR